MRAHNVCQHLRHALVPTPGLATGLNPHHHFKSSGKAGGPEWALGPLRKTLKKVEEQKQEDKFWQQWTTSADFNAYAKENCTVELIELNVAKAFEDKPQCFTRLVSKLEKETKALQEMHMKKMEHASDSDE